SSSFLLKLVRLLWKNALYNNSAGGTVKPPSARIVGGCQIRLSKIFRDLSKCSSQAAFRHAHQPPTSACALIPLGRRARHLSERLGEVTLVRKTEAEGHLGNRHSASGKQPLSFLDAFAQHVVV